MSHSAFQAVRRAHIPCCAAKDLYLGTKHLTIDDLGDAKLIPTELFRLICNAMAVRRYGLRALEIGKEE